MIISTTVLIQYSTFAEGISVLPILAGANNCRPHRHSEVALYLYLYSNKYAALLLHAVTFEFVNLEYNNLHMPCIRYIND